MVERVSHESFCQSSSSELSYMNLPFISRLLEVLVLPPCSDLQNGISLIQCAIAAGFNTREELDSSILQVYLELNQESKSNFDPEVDFARKDEGKNGESANDFKDLEGAVQFN